MRSPADDIAVLVATGGLGVVGATTGWSINIGWDPEKPENTITFYDMPGGGPEDGDGDLFKANIQVRVKSPNYREAYQKAWDVQQFLHAIAHASVNNQRYISVYANEQPTAAAKTETSSTPIIQTFTVLRQTIGA